MSYYSLISLMPKAPIGSLLLDSYPNAAVAYSLRKLRSAYTGSAIRVRRSVDNVEQDFGFVNNVLDTDSLLDFVGYNLLTYSQDTTQAVYSDNFLNTTGTPPYSGVITAPDGTMTGDKMIESTFTGAHYITYATVSILNATNYNISVYLKQGERTKVQVKSNIDNFERTCDIDLTNGNISNNTFLNTPIVTSEANGWYRFSVTILSAVTSSTIPIRVALLNGSGNIAYTGDGTSGAYIWGLQLSKTSTVKTYQKTVATVGGNGFVTIWYDQSGNGKHTTQTTATRQPIIVSSGNLVLSNGKVAVAGDGVDDTLINTTLSLTNPSSIFTVVDKVGTSGNFGLTAGGYVAGGFTLSTTGYGIYQNGPSFSPQYTNNNQSLLVFKTSTTGTNWEFYGNNTTVTNGGQNIGTLLGTHLSLFDRSGASGRANMYMQEYIIWSSDQMTNRLPIQSNINSHYNIY